MSVKSALRKLGRAYRAQDANAFDDAIEELEEKLEEDKKGNDEEGGDPDTIEVHNHIPDYFGRDTSIGELPPQEGQEKAFDSDEPPWFKEHRENTDKAFKSMRDSIEELNRKVNGEAEDEFGEEENLEMADRRRSNDEPSEREEMAERIKENSKDESNREILGELQFEAPPGTGDSKIRRATDSAMFEDSFQDVIAKAEILAPGIKLPAFDRAASPVKTGRAMFGLRRTALDLAYSQPATRGIIDSALSGRTFDSKRMPHGQVRVLFNATAAAAAAGNNQRATDHVRPQASQQRSAGIQSVSDINARNREKYGRK